MDVALSARPTVLIASAAEHTRTELRHVLEDAGWHVIVSNDGRDALVQALGRPPSLLIVDGELPFISGLQLCELLRDDAATRTLPIILIAAGIDDEFVARATTAGAGVVLRKPVAIDALLHHATDLTRVGRWRFWRPRRRVRPRSR